MVMYMNDRTFIKVTNGVQTNMQFEWHKIDGMYTMFKAETVLVQQIKTHDHTLILKAQHYNKEWKFDYFDGSLSDSTKRIIEDWFFEEGRHFGL